MRNLKRALSLTLASVMLLGMMVVGTSAASYPDVDDQDNVEAIEVVQAVGVMVGDEQGNFNPGTQVTRNEMAVIMAKLILGQDLADNYVGTCPFWDVPDWAQKYVAACYDNGIVAGIGGGAYGGDQTVTAEQAAAMMLRALGYSKLSDGASDWASPVVQKANQIRLFTGVGTNPKETLTRNQVAQLTLNTLESGMVEMQDNTMNITGTGGDTSFTITGGGVTYVYVTSDDKKFNTAIDDISATSIGSVNDDAIVELGEKLYNGDLKKYGDKNSGSDEEFDDFGRPAVVWTYKNDKIGTYTKQDELIATYTAKVSKGEMYTLLSSSVRSAIEKDSTKLTIYVNGGKVTNAAPGVGMHFIGDGVWERNSSAAIYTPVTESSRNGTLTEVYLDSDDNVTIVIIDTFIYQATSDYSASRDDVKMAAVGDTKLPLASGQLTLNGEDFNITDIKTDDYLLITAVTDTASPYDGTVAGTYEVKSVAVAETLQGEVTAYTESDSVTIDGTKYSYSATTLKSGSGVRNTQYTVGQDAVVVLDTYGNIIAVDEAVASSSYVFVKQFGGTSGLNTKAVAEAYFTDGTSDEISIERVGDTKNATTIAEMGSVNTWYTYSVNSDGKYVLYAPPARYNSGSANPAVGGEDDGKLIQNGKVSFLPGQPNALANDKTILIMVDRDGEVMTYTGTVNIPDVKMNSGSKTVYYLVDTDGYVDYAFVDLESADVSVVDGGEDTSFLYVTRFDGTNKASNATTYYTYKTVDEENPKVDKVVKFDAKEFGDSHPYALYYKPRYNADDEITSLTRVPTADGKYFNRNAQNSTITYNNGSLTFSNVAITWNSSDPDDVNTSGAVSYVVNSSSKIFLVSRDSSINKDSSANHEIQQVEPQTLESLLSDRAFNGNIAGATVSADNTVIDTLYVTVTDSTEYSFEGVSVSETSLSFTTGGDKTFNVVLPTGKTATITSSNGSVASASVTNTASGDGVTTQTVTVTPGVVNGTAIVSVEVTDELTGVSVVYQVRVNVSKNADPTPIEGALNVSLEANFNAPTIQDGNGTPISSANVGQEIKVVITQKAISPLSAGEAATSFAQGEWYKVTLGANNTEKIVQCVTAGELVVTYTVANEDLDNGTITVDVSAIVTADAPVETTTYTVTGITEGTITGTSNSATFDVTPSVAEAAAGDTVTLTVTLSEAVLANKQVVVTFTAPTATTVTFDATEGTTGKTVDFTMGAANVTVDATAAESAAATDAEKVAAAKTALGSTYEQAAPTTAYADADAMKTVVQTALAKKVTDAGAELDADSSTAAGGSDGFKWADTTPYVDGTLADEDGTDGSYDVTVYVKSGNETGTQTVTVTVKAMAFENTADGKAAAAALKTETDKVTTIDALAYDVSYSSASACEAAIKEAVENAIDTTNVVVTVTASDEDFRAPDANTETNPADGSVKVTVTFAYKSGGDTSATITVEKEFTVVLSKEE